jgi:small subunit ribosomal protein S21
VERKGRTGLKAIEVKVFDNDLEKAMRILKKKIQNDGLFKRLKLKKSYEKPSEYRRRKQREALRRQRIAVARSRYH